MSSKCRVTGLDRRTTGFIGATTRSIEVLTLDCMDCREESEYRLDQGLLGKGEAPCISFGLPALRRGHLVLLLIGGIHAG